MKSYRDHFSYIKFKYHTKSGNRFIFLDIHFLFLKHLKIPFCAKDTKGNRKIVGIVTNIDTDNNIVTFFTDNNISSMINKNSTIFIEEVNNKWLDIIFYIESDEMFEQEVDIQKTETYLYVDFANKLHEYHFNIDKIKGLNLGYFYTDE